MSERSTPETDAHEETLEAVIFATPAFEASSRWVASEFAKKLERERDEAKEALMEIEDRCVDCEDACNDIQKIRDIAVKALEGVK